MKASTKQIRDLVRIQALTQDRMEKEFILLHVPRLHRFLMDVFPNTRSRFNYMLAHNEDDRTKLTLLRGKKVVASNFDPS